MSDLPARPPPPAPPLPPGWTEHKAPTGHTYYYNLETKKSTYTRPVAETPAFHPPPPPPTSAYTTHDAPTASLDTSKQIENLIFSGLPQAQPSRGHRHGRGGYRGGFHGDHNNFSDRKRQPQDRPKHRYDIPNCAPWVLVKTKLKRRFVWNKDTNESFWKFPPDVMKAVIEFDRMEREKKERRERGEPSEEEEEKEDAAILANIEADLAAAEEDLEIVEVEGEEGMDAEEEYEEVEITDDEGAEASQPSKRQRTEEPTEDQPMEMGEDDLAWQLAQMEELEGMEDEYFDEEPPLSEEDCKALFKELLNDTMTSPYTPWDKVLDTGALYDDERYKALPNMKARKECFDEWAREKAQYLREQAAKQRSADPRISYLALLDRHATTKLYWPEFKRKFRKEPEMKDSKLSDKDKEKLYREHIKRLGMRSSDLKSDLTSLLKAQPLTSLNRSTNLETLPTSILTDIRYISLSPSSREPLIETFISTLPAAPEGTANSAEEETEATRQRQERQRREKALAERERRVREEKRRLERDLEYGRRRLREEEIEIERAMKVGKDGLRTQLASP